MSFEVTGIDEFLVTTIASIWSYPGMTPRVKFESIGLRETLETLLAGVRALP